MAKLVSGEKIICFSKSLGVMSVHKDYFCREGFEHKCNIVPGDVVVDIGAHVGSVSIPIAKKYGARVLAFEAHPDNFALLQLNQRLNLLENLFMYNQAVCSTSGGLVEFGAGMSSTTGSLLRAGFSYSSKNPKVIKVKGITLSDIIHKNNLELVKLLKVDVEGSEYDIFLNADLGHNLFKKIQFMIIEVHPTNLQNGKYELFNFFRQKGFEVKVLDRSHNGCEDFFCSNIDNAR